MINPLGRAYTPSDFTAGSEFEVCKRVYRVVDCDAKTMDYFKKTLRTDFGSPESYRWIRSKSLKNSAMLLV